MTFHAPVAAPAALNHDHQPCQPRWTAGAIGYYEDWHQKVCEAHIALRRAEFAFRLKRRLWLGIPYHEWEEALILARYAFDDGGFFNAGPVDDLLAAYTPTWDWRSRELVPALRVAPWSEADRRLIQARRRARSWRQDGAGARSTTSRPSHA